MPSRYWTRRVTRHLVIGAASCGSAAALYLLLESPSPVWRFSMATAYPGLALIALSLALGPLNVLRGRPNPVSFDLRRDIGIWAGLFSLAHVVAGLQVHFAGRFWYYFVFQPELRGRMPVRYDAFGLTNHTGLVVTLGVLALLALSNDISLARLGANRWKRLQQLNYWVFAGVLVHTWIYQVLEDRSLPWIVVAAAFAIAVVAVQLMGFRRVRMRARSQRT